MGSTALEINDTVEATFNAFGNDYWSAAAFQWIWTPISVEPTGHRVGNLAWTFLLDSIMVDGGSSIGDVSEVAHIPQGVTTSAAIDFDQLRWVYTLTGYISLPEEDIVTTTTLGKFLYFTDYADPTLPAATYHSLSAPVPEPSTMLLLGFGLVGLAGVSRKKMKK